MIIHGPFKRWPDAPLWVNILYFILEWVDYNLVDRASRLLAYRYELLDHHCRCAQCKRRRHA